MADNPNYTDGGQLRLVEAAFSEGNQAADAFMAAYEAHPGVGIDPGQVQWAPPAVPPVEYVPVEPGSLGQLTEGGAA